MAPPPNKVTVRQAAAAYKKAGSIRGAQAALGGPSAVSYGTVQARLQEAQVEGLVELAPVRSPSREEILARNSKPTGRVRSIQTPKMELPPEGKINTFYITVAQNNTKLHEATWKNGLALHQHDLDNERVHESRIIVGRDLYIKRGLGAVNDFAEFVEGINKAGSENKAIGGNHMVVNWDSRTEPYWVDERLELAPGLVWCGEMKQLPTAVNPLSGLDTYTGRKSAIFGHVKIAMKSIPSMKHEPTKFNYTTGTITQRNYIQRKAGIKAEFHHCFGFLKVEVDHHGNWFVRQLNSDDHGVLYDLERRARAGRVDIGHWTEAITWGDLHAYRADPVVKKLAWGEGGMLDTLHPRYQFVHDAFDFHTRNHHDRNNHHKMYERFQLAQDSVEEELEVTARTLDEEAWREWCQTIIVESNHDNALERWLRDDPGWYARDPINATLFLKLQLRKYEAIGDWTSEDFLLIEHALREHGGLKRPMRFLREDESFIICHGKGGGIENGLHGHNGPNGARGGQNGFVRMGRRKSRGHTHTAGIVDGDYVAGTSSLLDLSFNKGPSSWSQSHIVTYRNGKRCIVTMWNGKWRA